MGPTCLCPCWWGKEMRAQEAVTFSNINSTPANFYLNGGNYALDLNATVWGTATLNKVSQDGATLIAVLGAFGANGTGLVNLPPGQYQLTLNGITALYGCISRV